VKPRPRQIAFLLLLPFLLVPSTALVFVSTSRWVNAELGYVLGFLFYWVVWCTLIPLYILKTEGIGSLFREENPLFRRSNWLPATLLVLILVITVIMYPPTGLLAAPIRLLLIAVPVAIVNGVCEEALWRGLYVKVFPGNAVLGVIYPSIGFALWHLSPQLVVPAETGVWPFVASTFFLGISYGWISYRTGSIKWNAISHCIGGILDIGGAIAPSILVLVTQ
jgi:membrane protease YdiL (CAAX protease family)